MADDKTLTLSTLFKGQMDANFLTAVRRLRSTVLELNKALNQLGKVAGVTGKNVRQLGSDLSAYQVAAGKALSRTKGYQQAFAKLGDTYGKSEASMRRWLPLLNKADDAMARQAMSFEQAGIGGKKYYQTGDRIATMQGKLAGRLKYTANGISHVTKATEKVIPSTKKASTATDKLTKKYDPLNKQLAKVHGGLNRIRAAFKVTAAYGIAATAIYSVINALKVGVQAMVDYDQGLKNLQAITGATDAEVMAMGETIKTVARHTKFSTSEVAAGMTLLGQAGFDAGESMAAMHDTAMLATGTLSDMKTTTDLVTTTVRAFGLQATDSGRVVDVMANAINKSKLTIDKLRIAFNYIGATAAQAGLSIEQVAATAMNFANSGLRASTIGTGFRQVLSKILKPSERLSNALAAVGLRLDDINPKIVGWQGSLNALTNILYDSETKTVDMAKAFSLFGLRGAQAAAVIVSSFVSGKYQDALNKVYELGTAEEMAAKQAEGLGLKIKNLADRAKNIAVAFGEAGAIKALKGFIDGLRAVAAGIEAFAGSIAGQAIVQLAALTGGLKLARFAAVALYASLMKLNAVAAVVMTLRGLAYTLSGKTGLIGALATAGLYIKGFLAALGPVKIVLLAATGAFLAYRNAMQTSMKEVEQNAVKYMQLVNSLEAYGGALETTGQKALRFKDDVFQGKATNQAYLATLQRLVKAHPELADKIQLTIDAYKENNEALKEFASEASIAKVKALVQLHREYGEAAERARAWVGVWEDIKSSMKSTLFVFNKLLGVVTLGIEQMATGWGLIFDAMGKVAGRVPVVGSALERMLTDTSNSVKEAIDYWKEYLQTLGKGSEKAKEFGEKQKEVATEIANSYLTLKEKAGMSFGAIKRELEAMTIDSKKLSNELIRAIILAIDKGREATSAWVKKHGEALQSMTDEWLEYYNKLDILEQFDLVKKKASLESRAKKLREWLQGRLGDIEGHEEKINKIMKDWWAKELREYIEKEDKKVEKAKKSAEKILEQHKKLVESIKDLEKKLQDDLDTIRQSEMTGTEKAADQLKNARNALKDAITQAARAQSAEEIAAAKKAVAAAMDAYRKIGEAAIDAANKEKKAKRSVAQTTDSMYPVMQKKAEDYYSNVVRMESSFTESSEKEAEKRRKAGKATAEEIRKEWEAQIEAAMIALDGLMMRGQTPILLSMNTDPVLRKLDFVDEALEDIDDKVERPEGGRKLWLDTSKFMNAVMAAIEILKELVEWIRIARKEGKKGIDINIRFKSSGTPAGAGASLSSGVASAASSITTLTSTIGGGNGGGGGATYPVNFVGTGSTTKPLTEKITEIAGRITGLSSFLGEGASYEVDFKGSGSSATGLVDKIQQLIDKITELMAKFGDLENKTRKVFRTIRNYTLTGMEYIDLDKAGYTINVTRIPYHSGGLVGSAGGEVEPKEYVLRRPAVEQLGTKFLDTLNNIGPKSNLQDSPLSQGAKNVYNITFAPQIMTGDKLAMRNAAAAFKEAIDQTNHRWGTA